MAFDVNGYRISYIQKAYAFVVAILFSSLPALSQDGPLLIGESEREKWQAIGQIRIDEKKRKGICTGTLIAPDRVLTAAHCVTDIKTGHAYPLYRIKFIAAWHFGEHRGSSSAKNVFIHPEFNPKVVKDDHGIPLDSITVDLAVIELKKPLLKVTPAKVANSDVKAGPVAILGYRRDQPEALSDYLGCLSTDPIKLLIGLRCEVVSGTSGAPVLQKNADDEWIVIGVVSAQTKGNDQIQGLAPQITRDRLSNFTPSSVKTKEN